jgi:hypothetical protein
MNKLCPLLAKNGDKNRKMREKLKKIAKIQKTSCFFAFVVI